MNEKTGLGTLAISAAMVSYILVFLQFQVTGLILGLVAIALGLSGFMIATSLRLSDRRTSIISIVMGILATGLAVLVLAV